MKIVAIMISLSWGTILTAVADTKRDVAALLADSDPAHRIRASVSFIAGLPRAEISSVVKQAEEGYGPGRESLLTALVGRWVEVDSKAALAYARHDEYRYMRGDIFDVYFSEWARRDWNRALARATQLPEGEERATAIYALATFLASRDPAQAYALMKSVHTTTLETIDYPIYWSWARQDLAAATKTLIQDSGYGQNRPGVDLTWDIVDSLLDQNPQMATNWVGTLPEGRLRDTAFDHLVDVWGRLDPIAAVAWLKSLPASGHVHDEINNVSSSEQYSSKGAPSLIKPDPAFAMKAAEFTSIREEPFDWRRDQRMIAFVDKLAPSEFPLALEQIRRAPSFNCEDELDILIAKWTEVDLSGAVEAIPQARGFYDQIFATRVVTDLFGGWARHDPDAAFAYARQFPQGYSQCDVLQTTLRALTKKNPTEAYAAFLKLNNGNSHIVIIPVFNEWAKIDLVAATKALADERNWQGAIQGIIQSRLQHGLPGAVQWAHQLKNPVFRDKALADTALYADNPEETLTWLEKEPAFPSKDSAINDVAVDWANRNHVSALRHALQLPDGKERGSLMMYGLITYTYDDAPMAVTWCEKLPEGKDKQNSLWTVFGIWAENDPQSAAQYLTGKPADATASVLETVVDSWSRFDPPHAAQWLMELSTRESKTRAIAKIAEQWYRGDSGLATQWVNQLPVGAFYDAGASGICVTLHGDISPALKWARSIGDPKIRHDAIYNAYQLGTSYRGNYSSAPGIKEEIQNVVELTDAEKKKIIAQLPVWNIGEAPQPFTKPQLAPNH